MSARDRYARPLPAARRDPAAPRLRAEYAADALLLGRPVHITAAVARRGAKTLRVAIATTRDAGEVERLTTLAARLEQHAEVSP